MLSRLVVVGIGACLLVAGSPPPASIHGSFTIHLILHAIGEEQYDITANADGTETLTTTFEYTDRGNKRTTTATLTSTADARPLSLEVKGNSPLTAKVDGATTVVQIRDVTRSMPTPPAWAAVAGPSPFALQMMMMRAWRARGEPKQLALVSPNADPEPLEIVRVGRDEVTVGGKRTRLERYTVDHLMFGREILWTTADGDLAAAMTFAGGLPMEAVRSDLEPAFMDLYRAGVAQEMANLDAIGRAVPLAGLVDAGGARAFGHVTAETPEEGRAVVARYHAAGFEQIKLYTFLTADVVGAIAAEAHRLGMTVTGHVPQALSTKAGIEAGMDQINHLNYVTSMLRAPGTTGAPDLQSDAAQQAIRFLLDRHTVVDPTASWGEMAGHARDVDVASFEPGILVSPAVLDAKFRGMGGQTTAEQMRARTAQSLAVIGALHKAGVAIVPGSDTGLVGYGLHREIELYVEAGMTPLEAIQSATIVSARAMKLDKEVGTIEAGKRADLILVAGDPLKDITALRRVTRVVAGGRMYDAGALWRSVGFRPGN